MSIENYEIASFFPRRAIGPFNATITVEESSKDDLEITQHPVQQGASITDHAYVKPSTVRLNVMWNDTDAPLSETYANLLALQSGRVPFDVVTGKRVYRNMLMKALSLTTDALTENVLNINMELQKIIITSLEVVSVPERPKQANPGKTGKTNKAGTKSAKPASPPRKSSVLAASPPRKRSALAALAGKGR